MVFEKQILRYLNNLSAHKATGIDDIPLSRFVWDSASVIVWPLTHVINFCIIQGISPDDLKPARVFILFKKERQNWGW